MVIIGADKSEDLDLGVSGCDKNKVLGHRTKMLIPQDGLNQQEIRYQKSLRDMRRKASRFSREDLLALVYLHKEPRGGK